MIGLLVRLSIEMDNGQTTYKNKTDPQPVATCQETTPLISNNNPGCQSAIRLAGN